MSEENVLKIIRRYLFLTVALLMLCLTACGGNNGSPTQIQNDEETEQGIAFPYELEDGKLIVNSLFQSSVYNPDCNGEYADDVATLELVNVSGQFLKEALITVKMIDGTEIQFELTNVPTGKTVWAFSIDNISIKSEDGCESISCKADFEDNSSLAEDKVSVKVDDTTITLINLTGQEITNLNVSCHCMFDDVYYGGLTYIYSVASIPAEQSVTIDAEECYLGFPEIVDINLVNTDS